MNMNDKKIRNLAFIDGQNLYMATNKRSLDPWKIDLVRFRIYLKNKYKVDQAYYFLGYAQDNMIYLYNDIKNADFVLSFRLHKSSMIGNKKGNVDSDIIFHIMKKLYRKERFDKIVLVSGDGDYKLLIDFLIEENRFEMILFPERDRASSLYKHIGAKYFDSLDSKGVRNKIEEMKKVP
jgi:uncharacterized LabA/DUF88 family protein